MMVGEAISLYIPREQISLPPTGRCVSPDPPPLCMPCLIGVQSGSSWFVSKNTLRHSTLSLARLGGPCFVRWHVCGAARQASGRWTWPSSFVPPHTPTMSSLAKTHGDVTRAYAQGGANVKSELTRAKIELTQAGLLVPSPHEAAQRPQEVAMARDVLETGAFYSLRQRDVEGFDRYVGLLRVFYHDCGSALPASKNEEALLGLSLLRLLSSNAISQFHTTLETLPPDLVATSPYIQHPVNLERWLMEGSYSKVWRAGKEVPREEYSFFVDELMGTIR